MHFTSLITLHRGERIPGMVKTQQSISESMQSICHTLRDMIIFIEYMSK